MELMHLCPNIRSIIPHFHDLLLRLTNLCGAIICTEGSTSLSFEHHVFPDRLGTAEYIKAPKFQTLNVSLNNAWWTLWP